ncbi:hypothetical protein PGT21_018663 [Puccinia graminis f. sp. tritici]|uniref:Uncharacterized protein n=1 Tax=Puccinia graminis f. sp. tritici TaxID=56615 RepID=A0A5B0NCJ7_PUCGR|nr:hypothetical protein PGT21_018663 [Puccinia graminis f. sp. tritici]
MWSPVWEPEPSQTTRPSPNDMVVDEPVIKDIKPNISVAGGPDGQLVANPVQATDAHQELPPGLPVPFLKTTALIDLFLTSSSPDPSSHSSSAPLTSSNTSSTASSTYTPILAYIGLNHQGVQRLLLDDHNPPSALCIYTKEDVMRIFEGIAPDYVHTCSEYPPSSLAESDRQVMFFENMQWHFQNKRSTYLSTRNF